jgi:alanyl aminopeptidase
MPSARRARKTSRSRFSTFLEQAGVPMVKVALDCSKAPALHLEQSRYLPTGSKGSTNQVWSIPICVRYGLGKGESQCTLMTQAGMDWPLQAKSCPAWIDANHNAQGYYRVDYQGTLLSALTSGDVEHRLTAAGRRLSRRLVPVPALSVRVQ